MVTQRVSAVYGEIPQYARDALCRMILRDVERMFDDPATQADFEEWKRDRRQNNE